MKHRAWLLLCGAYNPAKTNRKSHYKCFEERGQGAVGAKGQLPRLSFTLISWFFLHFKIEERKDRRYRKWWYARIPIFQKEHYSVKITVCFSVHLPGRFGCLPVVFVMPPTPPSYTQILRVGSGAEGMTMWKWIYSVFHLSKKENLVGELFL